MTTILNFSILLSRDNKNCSLEPYELEHFLLAMLLSVNEAFGKTITGINLYAP